MLRPFQPGGGYRGLGAIAHAKLIEYPRNMNGNCALAYIQRAGYLAIAATAREKG